MFNWDETSIHNLSDNTLINTFIECSCSVQSNYFPINVVDEKNLKI